MNKQERIEMVRSMNTIIRSLNDEELIETWLSLGVADGDETDEDFADYCDNETLSDLMKTFLRIMTYAKDDGLYCDGVTD